MREGEQATMEVQNELFWGRPLVHGIRQQGQIQQLFQTCLPNPQKVISFLLPLTCFLLAFFFFSQLHAYRLPPELQHEFSILLLSLIQDLCPRSPRQVKSGLFRLFGKPDRSLPTWPSSCPHTQNNWGSWEENLLKREAPCTMYGVFLFRGSPWDAEGRAPGTDQEQEDVSRNWNKIAHRLYRHIQEMGQRRDRFYQKPALLNMNAFVSRSPMFQTRMKEWQRTRERERKRERVVIKQLFHLRVPTGKSVVGNCFYKKKKRHINVFLNSSM